MPEVNEDIDSQKRSKYLLRETVITHTACYDDEQIRGR
jgi:hypothetical protein